MDPLSLLGRAVVVFLLLGLTLWLLRRSDSLRRLRRAETPLEVLGSARLGKGASVALVRIGDADYALGVTDQAVSLLTEAELEPQHGDREGPTPATSPRSSFPAALQAQLGLLTRRGHGSRVPTDPAADPAPSSDSVTDEVPGGDDVKDGATTAEPVRVTLEDDAPAVADHALGADRIAELLAVTAVSALARPGRTTGARAPRGSRAHGGPDAGSGRTGQRRSARSRPAGGDTGAPVAADAA